MSGLVGPDGVLWRLRPDFACVLVSTCPSGDPSIVRIRNDLRVAMFHSSALDPLLSAPALLRHQSSPFGGAPPSHAYVGIGLIDCQGRASPWANPYWLMSPEAPDFSYMYSLYLDSRADLSSFLRPLAGKTLICDCNLASDCHARLLVQRVNSIFCDRSVPAPAAACAGPFNRLSMNALNNEATPGAPGDDVAPDCSDSDAPDESDDEGWPIAPPKILDDIAALNETVRGNAPSPSTSFSFWLPAWFMLIQLVRSAPAPARAGAVAPQSTFCSVPSTTV